MIPVQLKLSGEALEACRTFAREDDVNIGHFIRSLINREISRRRSARPPNRADERLVAPLRARLAGDLAHATNWHDLQDRLAQKGYRLQAAGGGLALHRNVCGTRLCKASELGFSYARLVERFRAGFPGHAHTWVADRVTKRSADPEDFDVVEPF